MIVNQVNDIEILRHVYMQACVWAIPPAIGFFVMHKLIILEMLCDPPVIVSVRDTWTGSSFVGRNVLCFNRSGLPKPVHKAVKFCMNFGNKGTEFWKFSITFWK